MLSVVGMATCCSGNVEGGHDVAPVLAVSASCPPPEKDSDYVGDLMRDSASKEAGTVLMEELKVVADAIARWGVVVILGLPGAAPG